MTDESLRDPWINEIDSRTLKIASVASGQHGPTGCADGGDHAVQLIYGAPRLLASPGDRGEAFRRIEIEGKYLVRYLAHKRCKDLRQSISPLPLR